MNEKYAKILVLFQTTKNLPLAIVAALKSIEDSLSKYVEKLVAEKRTASENKPGRQGLPGPKGNDGPEGARGGRGSDGRMGEQGPQGPMGPMGSIGPQGPQGPQGKQGIEGKQGSPDTGEEIIRKINTVPDTSTYKILASKTTGQSTVVIGMAGGGSGGQTGKLVKSYDLSSFLNGVLKTFAIPSNSQVISVISSSAPITFRQTVDYTYTSSSITFTSQIDASATLSTGQTLVIIYSEP